MPIESYKEITSKFWNLIYKEPYNETENNDEQQAYKCKQIDIVALDNEFKGGQTHPFKFEFGNLTNILGGP